VLQRESEQLHGLLQRLREHLKEVQDSAVELVAALSFATVFVSGMFSVDAFTTVLRGALAAANAICGARPANGVGTSCKPLAVLKCGRPTGYIGKCGNTITVTKRESTGRGVTRGVTAVTRGVRAVSVVTASVTAR